MTDERDAVDKSVTEICRAREAGREYKVLEHRHSSLGPRPHPLERYFTAYVRVERSDLFETGDVVGQQEVTFADDEWVGFDTVHVGMMNMGPGDALAATREFALALDSVIQMETSENE